MRVLLVCWAVCTSCPRGGAQAGRLAFPGAPWGLGAVGRMQTQSAVCCPGVQHGASWHQMAPFLPHAPSPLVLDVNSRSARVLFLLVVPGHLVFLYTISCMQGGHTTLTLIFIIFYMTAALLQVRTGRGVGRARAALQG